MDIIVFGVLSTLIGELLISFMKYIRTILGKQKERHE